MKYLLWLGCTALYLSSSLVSATKANFSGFATIGATYSDNQNLELTTDFLNKSYSGFTFLNESKIGFQTNLTLADKWDAVGQVVFQDRNSKTLNDFIELAFIRYRPNRNWSLRAGRVNSDLYLLSDYPYVGYAYLWSRPPNEFYSIASPANNFDGVDLEYKNHIANGFLRFRLGYGQTSPELQGVGNRFGFTSKDLILISASYQLNNWLIRLTHSQSNFDDLRAPELSEAQLILEQAPDDIWPAKVELLDKFDISGKSSSYDALGISYESQSWLFYSEGGISKNDWLPFSSSTSGYATLGYIQEQTTYFISLSTIKNSDRIPTYSSPVFDANTPADLAAYLYAVSDAVTTILDSITARQTTISAGAKLDLPSSMNIKLQLDHTNISPKGYGLWNTKAPEILTTRDKVNTLSLSFNVLF
ncbi:hypothetical protein [uncultured Paraglaciecola sp.]|uniref:hypothetical protein n=1 Tax=uncultured Paraglaciecola sp. TaxID=1765024 RepID=UPI00259A478B|nr:hypothetical protein [uncultured Paraglaciecola sp.]